MAMDLELTCQHCGSQRYHICTYDCSVNGERVRLTDKWLYNAAMNIDPKSESAVAWSSRVLDILKRKADGADLLSKERELYMEAFNRTKVRERIKTPKNDMRKIRFPSHDDPEAESSEPGTQKIQLWRVIGYDPVFKKVIVEDPKTDQRKAFYGTTWAEASADKVKVVNWAYEEDPETGEKTVQVEKVTARYEYLDPPKRRNPAHADSCSCGDCKPYKDMPSYEDH